MKNDISTAKSSENTVSVSLTQCFDWSSFVYTAHTKVFIIFFFFFSTTTNKIPLTCWRSQREIFPNRGQIKPELSCTIRYNSGEAKKIYISGNKVTLLKGHLAQKVRIWSPSPSYSNGNLNVFK